MHKRSHFHEELEHQYVHGGLSMNGRQPAATHTVNLEAPAPAVSLRDAAYAMLQQQPDEDVSTVRQLLLDGNEAGEEMPKLSARLQAFASEDELWIYRRDVEEQAVLEAALAAEDADPLSGYIYGLLARRRPATPHAKEFKPMKKYFVADLSSRNDAK
jgi:hypothetical protein